MIREGAVVLAHSVGYRHMTKHRRLLTALMLVFLATGVSTTVKGRSTWLESRIFNIIRSMPTKAMITQGMRESFSTRSRSSADTNSNTGFYLSADCSANSSASGPWIPSTRTTPIGEPR